jgi:hypothetical protein
MTVVETAEFLRKAKPLLSESERASLVAFLAANPESGEIIPETGGVTTAGYCRCFCSRHTRRAARRI